MKKAKIVTLNLDDEVYKRIRQIQAIEIHNTSSNVIFSKIINELLKSTQRMILRITLK